MINIDDFAKVEMKVGLVTKAENVEKSEKLIRLQVDFGGDDQRTIFTAVRTLGFITDDFTDKQFVFVTNLEPRKMMGEESQGMILAADANVDGQEKPFFITAEGLPLGAKVG
jgi:methionine--tRNA ligase beta chain